ncbi:MAG: hypothetical protein JWM93_1342 [Frankiales bacterium]|nr:hypothetical protein [Frankiales bacterium]
MIVDDPAAFSPDSLVRATVREELGRFVRHRYSRATWLVVVALSGAVVALLLAGSVKQRLGPVDTTMSLRPAVLGDTRVNVPPLGNLGLDTHDGPLQLDVSVDRLRLDDARQLFGNPRLIESLEADVTRGVKRGLLHLLVKAVLVALAGSIVLTVVVYRRMRAVVTGAVVTLVALVAAAVFARVTWRSNALATPTYTGVLALAPAAIGNVEDLQSNFTRYGEELSKIVTNVSKLYDVTSTLPQGPSDLTIRVLFVSDIHDNPAAFDVIKSVIAQFGVAAVVDTGDLSDHGLSFENDLYTPIRELPVPYVFVRGNHDSASTEAALRAMPNVVVLDDSMETVAGLRIAGSGDPNFTPDQSNPVSRDDQLLADQQQGERLAAAFGATPDRPPGADVVLVHEPPAATPLYGRVPLVLAGHTHVRAAETHNGTQLLVQGSTGGAGLRGLEHDTPTPLDLSVLYFDPTTKKLVAYDDLQLGGLGLTSVEIQRHAVPPMELQLPGTELPTPQPAPPAVTPTTPPALSPTPTGSLTASGTASPTGRSG